MSEVKLLPDARQLAGRLYGLQEAAVIAGETSIGMAIMDRIKFIEANVHEPALIARAAIAAWNNRASLTPKQQAAEAMFDALVEISRPHRCTPEQFKMYAQQTARAALAKAPTSPANQKGQ